MGKNNELMGMQISAKPNSRVQKKKQNIVEVTYTIYMCKSRRVKHVSVVAVNQSVANNTPKMHWKKKNE